MECRNCSYYKAQNCRRQYIDLPDGKTCADCIHVKGCIMIFGAEPENTICGWEPVHFQEKDHLLLEEMKWGRGCEGDIDRVLGLIKK